jgi:hypothetical protein
MSQASCAFSTPPLRVPATPASMPLTTNMGLPQVADAAGAAARTAGLISRSASGHHAGLALSLAGVSALVLHAAAAP